MTKRGKVPYLVMFLVFIFFLYSHSVSALGACCANSMAADIGVPICIAANPNLVSQELCCDIFDPNWDTSGNPLIPDSLQECQNEYFDAGPLTDCSQSTKTYVQVICAAPPTTVPASTTTGTLPPTTLPVTTTFHITTTTVGPIITTTSTSTTSGASTTTTIVAYREVCNNGIDDNSNGYTDCSDGYCLATRANCDPTRYAEKCTWNPDNTGDSYRCCAFSQDCDNNDYAETCGPCPCETRQERPENVALTHVQGQYKLNVGWQMSCNGPVTFDIYRCEGSNCNPVDKRNSQPVTQLSFTDTIQKPLTIYCYEVRANYGWVQKRSDIICTMTGDKECLDNRYPEFCGPPERPTLRLNCDMYNRKQVLEDCTAAPNGPSWRCFGPYMDSGTFKTKCIRHSNCDLCNYLFKFFGNPFFSAITIGSQTRMCSDLELCYSDTAPTIADQFFDCEKVTAGQGCYEYHSKEACEESALPNMNSNNRCLDRNCTWNWISEPLGVGVCAEQDPALQKCELCTNKNTENQFMPNAVFSLCTVDTCKKYGDCYPKDIDGDGTIGNVNPTTGTEGEACLNMRDMSCEAFTQNDCVNNPDSKYENEGPRPQQIVVDVTYNDPVLKEKRISGTNSILKHSYDYFDFGVCAYSFTNKCFKDRDYDGKKDPNPLDMVSPRTVIGNNLVMQTLQLPFQVVDEKPAGTSCTPGTPGCTGSQALFTCIVNSNAPACYPRNQTTTAPAGTVSIYSAAGNGTYKLYYYGIDRANNLEVVKYVNVTVDREPPIINLTPPYYVYKAEAMPFNDSNVTIFITVSEYSKCNDKFNSNKQQLKNSNGTFFAANYSNLSDGYYAYMVTCADPFGNSATVNTNIRVDADTRISNLYPNGTIDTPNATLIVRTRSRAAICEYRAQGQQVWNRLEIEKEANSRMYWDYSHQLTGILDGAFSYDIRCIINGVPATDGIRFVVDTTAPTTTALDENGDPYDFTRPRPSHQVYLSCADEPKEQVNFTQIGYGCDKTWYCTGAGPCTPTTIYANPANPITINSGSYFCFKSREKTRTYMGRTMGGKDETTRCVSLVADRIPPYLYVDLLDKVAANAYYLTNQNPLRITGRIADPAFDSSVSGSTWPATLSANQYIENSMLFADFNFTTSLTFTGNYVEVWFRYVDANNYYALRIDNTDKFPGRQNIRVSKKASGTEQVLVQQTGLTILESRTINLEIKASGTEFRIGINSTTFNYNLTFSDSSFSQGKLGAKAAASSAITFGKVLVFDYGMQPNNKIYVLPEGGVAYTKVGLANWETFALNVILPGSFSSCKKCTKIVATAYDRADNTKVKNYLVYLDQNGPFFDNSSVAILNAQNQAQKFIEFGRDANVRIRVYDTDNTHARVNVTRVTVTLQDQTYTMINKTKNLYNTVWEVGLGTASLEPGVYDLTFTATDMLNNTNSTVSRAAIKINDTKAPTFNITVFKDELKTQATGVVYMGTFWATISASEPSRINSLNITNTFNAPPLVVNVDNLADYKTSWNGLFTINSINYLNQNEKILTLRLNARDTHGNTQTAIIPLTLILNTTGPTAPIFDPALANINGAYDDVYPDYLTLYSTEMPLVFYTNKSLLFMTGSSPRSSQVLVKTENRYYNTPLVNIYSQARATRLMNSSSLNAAGKGVRAAARGSSSIVFNFDLRNEPLGRANNYLEFAGHDRKAYGSYKKFYKITGSSYDGTKTTIAIDPALEQNIVDNEVVRAYDRDAPSDWFGAYTSSLAAGNNSIYASGVDAFGNEGQSSVKSIIFLDNSTPTIVSKWPPDSWALGNQSVNITLTVKDLSPSSRIRTADTNITIYYTNSTGSFRLYKNQVTKVVDIADLDSNNDYLRLDFDTKSLINVAGLTRHFYPLPNGKYDVSIWLRDRAHNYLATQWVFYIHLGVPDMPQIALTEPDFTPISNPFDINPNDYAFFINRVEGFGFSLHYPSEANINLSSVNIVPNDASVTCLKQQSSIDFNCYFGAALNPNVAYKVNFSANRVLSGGLLGPRATNFFTIVTDTKAPSINRIDANNLTRANALISVRLINLTEPYDTNATLYLHGSKAGSALTRANNIDFNNVNVGNLPDGIYLLTAGLHDQAGNSYTTSKTIRVDNTPPQLFVDDVSVTDPTKSIIRVSDNQWVTGDRNVSVSGHYFDPVINYICQFNRKFSSSCTSATGGVSLLAGSTYQFYTRLVGLTNGTNEINNITLVGVDRGGNRANISIKVIVDRTPPIISLVSPGNSYSNNAKPFIQIKTNEVATCNITYSLADNSVVYASMAPINGGFNHTHQVTADLAGDRSTVLNVECKDQLGSIRDQGLTISVDTVKPIVTGVSVTQAYRNSSTSTSSTYTVYSPVAEAKLVAIASEPVICKYGTNYNYAAMKKFIGYDSKTYAIQQTSNSTGTQLILNQTVVFFIMCEDRSGNVADAFTVNIRLDPNAPISPFNPKPLGYVNTKGPVVSVNTFRIANCNITGAGARNVQMARIAVPSSLVYNYTYQLLNLQENIEYTVTVTCLSSTGNLAPSSSITFGFIADTTKPTLSEVKAVPGYKTSSTTSSSTYNVSYPSVDTKLVAIANEPVICKYGTSQDYATMTKFAGYDQKAYQTQQDSPAIDSLLVVSQSVRFYVLCEDRAGNVVASAYTVNVKLDPGGPVTPFNPKPISRVSSTSPVVSVNTNKEASCDLSGTGISGGSMMRTSLSSQLYNYTYPVSSLQEGRNYTVTTTCLGPAGPLGPASSLSFSFAVDTTEPAVSDASVSFAAKDANGNFIVYSPLVDPAMTVRANEPVICKYGTTDDYAAMKKFPGYDSRQFSLQQTSNSTKSQLVLSQTVSFYVRCEDKAGNVGDAFTVKIKLDPSAPIVPTNGKPVGYTNTRNPVVSVNTYNNANCNITGSGVRNAPMTRTATATPMLYNYTYNFYNLQDNVDHTVTVTCLGSTGNLAPSSSITFGFTVDTMKPNIVEVKVDPAFKNVSSSTASTYTVFSLSAEPLLEVTANEAVICKYGTTQEYSTMVPFPSYGIKEYGNFQVSESIKSRLVLGQTVPLYVKCEDRAGNIANVYVVSVKTDPGAPITPFDLKPTGRINFIGPVASVSTFREANCNITGAGVTAMAMVKTPIQNGQRYNYSYQFSNLQSEVNYSLSATCIGPASSIAPSSTISSSFMVDVTKPTVTDVSVANAFKNSSTGTSSTYTVISSNVEPRLVVTANEPVICKYGTTDDYAAMKKFPGYDSKTYAASQTSNSTKSQLVQGQTLTYFVRCEDLVGNIGDAYTVNIKLDTNVPILVFNPKPTGYVNTKSPVVSVNTFRPANCNITGAGVTNAMMTRTVLQNGELHNFTYQFSNLNEDMRYTVTVSCLGSPQGTLTFSFVIDATGPVAEVEVESGTHRPRIYVFYYEDITVQQATLVSGSTNIPMTKQDISDRRFIYQPNTNLSNAAYTFTVTARDVRGNLRSTQKAFTIPVSYVNITLVKPRGGMVSTLQFEVQVSTDKSATCRYNYMTDTQYQTMNQQFTTADNRTHRIDDFNYTSTRRTIYVRCADRWGTPNPQGLKIDFTYDPNPPTITALVNPALISEARLLDGMMQAYTTLTATANKASLCRYSLAQQDYDLMENNMAGSTTNHTSNIIVPNPPEGSQSYTYYVRCASLAGIMSDVKTITFTVDLNAQPAISYIMPPDNGIITNGANQEINVSTNKPTECQIRSTSSLLNFTASATALGLNHQFSLPTLTAEGTYSFTVTCNDTLNQNVSATTRLRLDKTPPTAPEIVYLYSCTGKEVFFRVKSEDNLSEVVGYNITLNDDTNSTSIITKNFFDGDEDQNFRLTRDGKNKVLRLDWTHTYILTIGSVDGAGLESDNAQSDFQVDPEDSHCSSTPPPSDKHCANKATDANETDKDCGGVCVKENLKCDNGEKCLADTDCVGNYCNPATKTCDASLCNNNQTDSANGESDVDCGGTKCQRCGIGKTCRRDADCTASADVYCDPDSYKCTKKSCSDNVKNQHDGGYETDKDCGGPCSREGKLCDAGLVCSEDADCESEFCHPITKLCAIPTCSDEYQNQDETGLNCGGVCAAQGLKCETGVACIQSDDCVSSYCSPAGECEQSPSADIDNDGIPDAWESQHNLDPNNPEDAAWDNDKDGLTNLDEYKYSTDPNNPDSDGDGISDKDEISAGTNPNDPNSYPKKSSVFRTILLILIFIIIIAGAIYLAYTELRKMGGLKPKKKTLVPPEEFSRQRTLGLMSGPTIQGEAKREGLLPRLAPGELAAKKMIKDREKSQQLKKLFGAFGGEEKVEGASPGTMTEKPAEKPEAPAATEEKGDKWVMLKTKVKKAEKAAEDDIFKKLSNIAKQRGAKKKEADVFKELSKIAKRKK